MSVRAAVAKAIDADPSEPINRKRYRAFQELYLLAYYVLSTVETFAYPQAPFIN